MNDARVVIMGTSLKQLLAFTGLIVAASVAYFGYAFTQIPQAQERETFLSEMEEGVGEIAHTCT